MRSAVLLAAAACLLLMQAVQADQLYKEKKKHDHFEDGKHKFHPHDKSKPQHGGNAHHHNGNPDHGGHHDAKHEKPHQLLPGQHEKPHTSKKHAQVHHQSKDSPTKKDSNVVIAPAKPPHRGNFDHIKKAPGVKKHVIKTVKKASGGDNGNPMPPTDIVRKIHASLNQKQRNKFMRKKYGRKHSKKGFKGKRRMFPKRFRKNKDKSGNMRTKFALRKHMKDVRRQEGQHAGQKSVFKKIVHFKPERRSDDQAKHQKRTDLKHVKKVFRKGDRKKVVKKYKPKDTASPLGPQKQPKVVKHVKKIVTKGDHGKMVRKTHHEDGRISRKSKRFHKPGHHSKQRVHPAKPDTRGYDLKPAVKSVHPTRNPNIKHAGKDKHKKSF